MDRSHHGRADGASVQIRVGLAPAVSGPQAGISGRRGSETSAVTAVRAIRMRRRRDPPPRSADVVVLQIGPDRQAENAEWIVTGHKHNVTAHREFPDNGIETDEKVNTTRPIGDIRLTVFIGYRQQDRW